MRIVVTVQTVPGVKELVNLTDDRRGDSRGERADQEYFFQRCHHRLAFLSTAGV